MPATGEERLRDLKLAGWWLLAASSVAWPAPAAPPSIEAPSWPDAARPGRLPGLRAPSHDGVPHIVSIFARQGSPLPPAVRRPSAEDDAVQDDASREAATLRAAMAREVPAHLRPLPRTVAEDASRAYAQLLLAHQQIDAPQLVVVVDRNPAVQTLTLMLARPGGPDGWRAIGAAHVSTGQAGRKDYYLTPVGVFAHTDAILDFRAAGTRNEHHVRGLGLAGMRVWDFGWQWALKGWHTDGAGGDIRLQMHATDPDLLERRLGRPASEGCVRVPSSLNRFMDRHGVLDADYERAASEDGRYRALLAADRTPTPLGGRLLIVIDTSEPADAPPTVSLRPSDWPDPTLGGGPATAEDSLPE